MVACHRLAEPCIPFVRVQNVLHPVHFKKKLLDAGIGVQQREDHLEQSTMKLLSVGYSRNS